jgi:hypothetical protein
MALTRICCAVLLLCVAGTAQSRRIDLTPYGFRPTSNESYKPHAYSSYVYFLSDQSLLISFRIPDLVKNTKRKLGRDLGKVRIVHLDGTGRKLGSVDMLVSRYVPYLWPTRDGFAVVSGDLILFSPEMRELRRLSPAPKTEAIRIVPTLNAMAVFEKPQGMKQEVALIDMSTLQPTKTYEVDAGMLPAFTQDGYAVLGHNGDQLVVRMMRGEHRTEISLPPLPCRPRLTEATADAVVAGVCERYVVAKVDGGILMNGQLQSDEGDTQVFNAFGANRFGYASLLGFSGYPVDEQREHASGYRLSVIDVGQKRKVFSQKITPLPKLGGAFAISSDGKHVAALEDGAVEIFDVP